MNAKTPRRQEGIGEGPLNPFPWRLGVLAFIPLLICSTASGASPAEVDAALHKAKAFLYAQQNDAGTWEKSAKRTSDEGQDVTGSQWGGLTALATYALL